MIYSLRILFASMTLALIAACGTNPFKTYDKKDPAEDASVALEQNNPQKAINILEAALADDPGNVTYTSLLSMAYAQRAGIDPLTLAQKMGTSTTSSSTSSTTSTAPANGVTSLFSVMPAATDANIADVDKAVALIISIPNASRISADTLKLAMFQTAAMTLRAKALDTNGDGVLSPAELLAMSTTSATAILSQLAGAAGAFAGNTSTSTTDAAASAQVTKIQAAIDACPGASTDEKLKNYLAQTNSSTTSP